MTGFQIFGLQFLLSLIVYSLIAGWYVRPRLAPLPLGAALTPLLFLHAFRHLGMVFLVPTVVGRPCPPRSPSRPRTATSSPRCWHCWPSSDSGASGDPRALSSGSSASWERSTC